MWPFIVIIEKETIEGLVANAEFKMQHDAKNQTLRKT